MPKRKVPPTKAMTGKQLQKLLDDAGISQLGMARLLNINARHMRRYIAGDAMIPHHIAIAAKCLAGRCEHAQEAA